MMARVQAAYRAFRQPVPASGEAAPQKNYTYDLFSLRGSQGTLDSQLLATTWGATLAYYRVPAVKACVDFIAENAAIVPIVERDSAGDEVARSDKNPNDSAIIRAILEAYQYHGVPFIQEWVAARLLYGMNFIQLVENSATYVRGFRWLNPNAVTIYAPTGEIEGYYYGAYNTDIPPTLTPKQVLYSRGFNPGDDIYGFSQTLNIISKANISLDFDRFTIAYYRNGGQLGMAVSFKEKTDFKEAEKLSAFWRETFRGVDNFFKTHISHLPLDYNQFDPIDISKPLEVSKTADRAIHKGYRVPPELTGDTTDNPYQFSDETKNAAMQTAVKPHLDAVANSLNNRAMQYFAPKGHTVAFDFAQWETVSADVISQDIQATIMPITEGASKRGYNPDPRLEGIYMVNGRPMHVEVIRKVAMEIPPEYQQQQAPAFGDAPALPQADAGISSSQLSVSKASELTNSDHPASAYIPLGNNADILRVQRELKQRFTDDRIEWQSAPTLHVTLCYAGIVSDSAIEKMSTLINLEQTELQPVQSEEIDYFDTPDGKALHIPILKITTLDAIQADVYSAFQTEAYDLSAYSLPANWKPHITLAYIPDDIEIDLDTIRSDFEWLSGVVIPVDTVIIGRDDYDPVLTLKAPEYIKTNGLQKKYDPNQPRDEDGQFGSGGGSGGSSSTGSDSDATLPETEKATFITASDPLSDDLVRWQKVAMKRYKSGKLDTALSFESDVLPPALHAAIRGALSTVTTPDEIYTVFDDADRWLHHAEMV